MKTNRTLLTALMSLCLSLILFVTPSLGALAEAEQPDTVTITDHAGRTVTVPINPERVVVLDILPLASVLTVFLGSAQTILAMEPASMNAAKNGILSELYPDVLNVSTEIMQGDDVWISVSGDRTMKKIEQLPERKPSPLKQWALADSPDDIDEDLGLEAALRLTRVMVMAYGR